MTKFNCIFVSAANGDCEQLGVVEGEDTTNLLFPGSAHTMKEGISAVENAAIKCLCAWKNDPFRCSDPNTHYFLTASTCAILKSGTFSVGNVYKVMRQEFKNTSELTNLSCVGHLYLFLASNEPKKTNGTCVSTDGMKRTEQEARASIETKDTKDFSAGLNSMVGTKAIIRTYSAGVWFGEVAQKAGSEVILKNARCMWRWWAAESSSLSAVAIHGIQQNKSKIAEAVPSVWLEAIEIIPCSDKAIKSIEGAANVKAG